MLRPDARPTYWRHLAPRAYDADAIGWRHEPVARGHGDIDDSAERRLVYDTTLTGYGNQGHRYGEDLTEAEIDALLEYLKTL